MQVYGTIGPFPYFWYGTAGENEKGKNGKHVYVVYSKLLCRFSSLRLPRKWSIYSCERDNLGRANETHPFIAASEKAICGPWQTTHGVKEPN